jgi:hypothetical protein
MVFRHGGIEKMLNFFVIAGDHGLSDARGNLSVRQRNLN